MENTINLLGQCQLFNTIPKEVIQEFISTFPCQIKDYTQGSCIISKDDTPNYIAIVLRGTLGIYSDSLYGGHTLIGIADKDYLFGFIARFYNESRSITALYARSKCEIAKFIIPDQMSSHDFLAKTDNRIVSNIFFILTKHIESDFYRMHIISTHSVRIKLVRFLIQEHIRNDSLRFDSHFNRTELANYLGVYRTSLIHEIKKMCEEEMIEADKNSFTILNLEQLIEIEQLSYE